MTRNDGNEKIRTLDLFSGIGGIALGLERTGGFETVCFCEIDAYCRKVLQKHWPLVPIIEDVKDVTASTLRDSGIGEVECITAGFPCQPFSLAGQRKGERDERFLWPEVIRCIRDIGPRWVLLENVPGILSIDRGNVFGAVLRDLAAAGYDAEWQSIPAAAVGAPHLRWRVFIVAYANGVGLQGGVLSKGRDQGTGRQKEGFWGGDWKQSRLGTGISAVLERWQRQNGGQSPLVRMDDGIPDILDRLRCLGNAVVPQVAEYVGRMIVEADSRRVHV